MLSMPPATPVSRSPARTAGVDDADRADARGAHLVDRLGGHLLRDAALDLSLARGDLALAGLQHLAHHDLLHLVRLDARRARARRRSPCRPGRSRRSLRARRPSCRRACARRPGSRSVASVRTSIPLRLRSLRGELEGYTPRHILRRRCAPPSAREPRPTPRPTRSASACSRARRRRPTWTEALGGRLGRLIESGEAKGSFKKVALLHPDGDDRRRARDRRRPRQARRVHAGARAHRRGGRAWRGRAMPARSASPGRFPTARDAGRHRRRAGRGNAAGRLPVRPLQDRATTTTAPRARRRSRSSSGEDLSAAIARGRHRGRSTRTPRATCRTCPSNDLTPAKLAEHALRRAAEIDGPRGRGVRPRRDREALDGRPARRREGLARGAALHRAALRRRRRRAAARHWSARRSPSTPAGSRSSPRQRCRR